MSTKIVIQHGGSSSLAGQRQEFEQARVTLGRRPGNDVVFDSQQDRLVSGHHAEIVLRAGDPVLRDLGSSNGTFVNGTPVSGEVALRPRDRIVLGSGGPELRISTSGGAVARAEPAKRRGALDSLLRTMGAGAAAAKPGGIGVQTMFLAIEKRVGRERRRMAVIGSAAAAVVLLTSLMAWRSASAERDEIQSGLARNQAQRAADRDRFGEIGERLRGSVYLVTRQRRSGDGWLDQQGGGTAWHVDDGRLATNAHVAVTFTDLDTPRQRLVARTFRDGAVVELEIESVVIHPAYVAFSELVLRARPYEPGSGFLEVPPAWDVALMTVKGADRARMGTPIPIARDEVLYGLKTGTPLCYLGFPSEGTTGGGTNRARPVATFRTGRLSKLQDYFMAPGDATDMHLLTVAVDASGGASGSPIVDEDGAVVALLNSGDVLGVTSQGRITGDNTYGMRVDVLRELLDGRADELLARRLPVWRQRLLEAWRAGRATFLEEIAVQVARDKIESGTRFRVRELERRDVALPGTGASRAQTVRLAQRAPGIYLVIALPKTRPMSLGMTATTSVFGNTEVTESDADDWYCGAFLSLVGPSRLDLRLFTADDEPAPADDVEIVVWAVDVL